MVSVDEQVIGNDHGDRPGLARLRQLKCPADASRDLGGMTQFNHFLAYRFEECTLIEIVTLEGPEFLASGHIADQANQRNAV